MSFQESKMESSFMGGDITSSGKSSKFSQISLDPFKAPQKAPLGEILSSTMTEQSRFEQPYKKRHQKPETRAKNDQL